MFSIGSYCFLRVAPLGFEAERKPRKSGTDQRIMISLTHQTAASNKHLLFDRLHSRRPILGSDIRVARSVAAGAPVTALYALFCRRHACDTATGVFLAGRPDPLPYVRPIQCRACGNVFEGNGAPDDFMEHPGICPGCGDLTSFRRAPRCARCRTFPCTCLVEDEPEDSPHAVSAP